MMMKAKLYARTGAVAIAAILALSSTPMLAQEADPAAAEPAASLTTTPTPDPATEAPAATTTTTTAAEPALEPAAKAAPAKRTATVRKAALAKAAATAAAAARPAPSATPAEPAAPALAVAAAAPMPLPTATPEPVAPPAEPVATAEPTGVEAEAAAMLGGGALALLALGGTALALRRRRRRHEEEDAWQYDAYQPEAEAAPAPVAVAEPLATHEPVATPQPVTSSIKAEPTLELNNGYLAPAASAFAWGNSTPVASPAPRADPIGEDDGSDRRPGETWVERAHRGPSPANPSVSLKNRLRRAAFFDKRERDVAAGTAVPVEADAGLPNNIDEPATHQRQLETA